MNTTELCQKLDLSESQIEKCIDFFQKVTAIDSIADQKTALDRLQELIDSEPETYPHFCIEHAKNEYIRKHSIFFNDRINQLVDEKNLHEIGLEYSNTSYEECKEYAREKYRELVKNLMSTTTLKGFSWINLFKEIKDKNPALVPPSIVGQVLMKILRTELPKEPLKKNKELAI